MLKYRVYYTYSAPTRAHPDAIAKGAQDVTVTRFEAVHKGCGHGLLSSKVAASDKPNFEIISVEEL